MRAFVVHKFLTINIIVLLGLMSCINEIKFNENQMAPELVVNSLITPDSVIKLNLSLSRFFLSSEQNYTVIKNYEVKLWLNDMLKETMLNKSGTYVSVYKPKIGDYIKIIIKNPENQKLTSCKTVIQKRISILSVDSSMTYESSGYLTYNDTLTSGFIKTDTLGQVRNFKFNFKTNFKDSLNFENYYRILATLVQYYADGKTSNERLKLKPDDLVFEKMSESGIFDNNKDKLFNIFRDDTFDGTHFGIKTFLYLKRISIRNESITFFKLAGYKTPIKTEIIFDLQSISPEFFKYLKSVKENNTDLQYLSEPVQVYNNIYGGIGILGSYTHSFFKIALPIDSKTFYYQ